MSERPRIVIVGAGAIGSSIAGWIAPKYKNLSLLARGTTLEVIRNHGLKFYLKGGRSTAATLPVRAVGSLAEVPSPDIVVIAVKNYDLEATARELRDQLGNSEPAVVALQNGVLNQKVLPSYFTRIIYGVVCYNAFRDAPGEVGHDSRGYIIIGTPMNDLQNEMHVVKNIFDLGLRCVITDRLQDAVHCKLVINLANALNTLVGFQRKPMKSFNILVHLTFSLYLEGIQLLQAAGFHEHSLGPIPSWRSIKIGSKLPPFLVSPLYRSRTKSVGPNSMAQDVFGGNDTTELETLNGYMLNLARKTGFPTPINETIYQVAKERFKPGFEPISEEELWAKIRVKVKQVRAGTGG